MSFCSKFCLGELLWKLVASTGGGRGRILKQRGREDLKEGIRFFTELLGAIGPMSGSSSSFSGTSVSFCSKFCLGELLWNAEPVV
jgi:hypothetical protein